MPVNGPTNRIRIAVSINDFGQWAAWGRWDMRDEANMEEANGHVGQDGPLACYFVEVDVPVPTYELLQAALKDQQPKVVDYKEPKKEDK